MRGRFTALIVLVLPVLAACGGTESRAKALAEACWVKEAPAAFMYKDIKDVKTELKVLEVSDADRRNGLSWKADAAFKFSGLQTEMNGEDRWVDSFGSLAVIVKNDRMLAGDSYHGIECAEDDG